MTAQVKDNKGRSPYIKGTLATFKITKQIANLHFGGDIKAAAKAIENKFK